MEKTKVCAYARVSTDSIDQLNSYENQVYYFKNEIGRRNDLELVHVFKDRGVTGTKFNTRTGLLELLELCGITCDKNDNFSISRRITDPPFKYIYFKNTSRLGRNSKTFELVRLLREQGIYCIFIEQCIETQNISSDVLLQITQVLDSSESVDKSLKVSTGIRVGATRGVVQANSRLYGYKYIQSENRLITIDSEAEVIRLIYKMYLDRLGIRRIINKLNESGIYTRQGKEFGKSSIDRILTNEKYYGANVRMKYKRPPLFSSDTTIKVTKRESWIVHEECENIEPIITKEMFDKCREIRESRRNINNQVGIYHGTSIFATKLICSECGQPYYSDVDKGRRFYKCATKKKYGVSRCDSKNISEKKLLEYISGEEYKVYIQGIKLVKVRKIKSEMRKLEELIDADTNEIVKVKKEELENLREKRARIVDIYLDNLITKTEMTIRADKVDVLIEGLEESITLLSANNKELIERIETGNKRIEEIKSIVVNDSYTVEEILQDIDNIEVSKCGDININWRFDKQL